MKKYTALLALAAVLGLGACAAEGGKQGRDGRHQPHGEMRGEMRGKRDGLPRGMDKLNLSDAQKQQIQQIFAAERQQAQNARPDDAAREQYRAQREAITSGTSFDEARARNLIGQEQAVHAEREISRLRTEHAVWQVLTPEQREQWKQMRERRAPQERGSRPMERGAGEPVPEAR